MSNISFPKLFKTFFILLALMIFGCNNQSANQSSGSQVKPVRIAIVTNNSSDWWTISQRGAEKAAGELPNVSLDFRMLPEGTAAAQKTLVDDLLVKGVDGIAVS